MTDSTRNGWITCQTCGGSGDAPRQHDPDTGARLGFPLDCPDCQGIGEVPSDGLVEAAAKAAYDFEKVTYRFAVHPELSSTRSALIAARRYEEGQT